MAEEQKEPQGKATQAQQVTTKEPQQEQKNHNE